MGQRQFKEQQPRRRQTSKVFRITFIGVIALIILLGLLITWLLLTQDFSKATSLVSLIASILAIVVAPITIFSLVPRTNSSSEEHYPLPDSLTHFVDSQTPLLPTTQSSTDESQTSSNATRRTPIVFQSSSGISQDQKDVNIVIQKQSAYPHFQAGPPLSRDTSLYIERKADRTALTHLQNMDYISFIEPRLQGKTSLIYRLMQQLESKGYAFVICDLTNERFRKDSEEKWYHSLSEWILKKLDFIAEETQSSLPINSATWQTFLEAIAKSAKETKWRVVIILDELRDMPSAYTTPFFTVIRSIYNERAINPPLEHLTFITSGAFNPKELIQDDVVSRFNVDQRIELEDFTFAQVRQLVDKLQLPSNIAETVAKRVYYWTDGQPYLTQKLCLLLMSLPESELIQSPQLSRGVDKLAKQLIGDTQYMRRFRRLSEKEPKLFQYIQGIADGHKPKFNESLNDEHFRLANIYGVMKADSHGRCRIRNRVCEQVLRDFIAHIQPKSS